MRVLVGGDLERQAGIGKTVHFVEHDHGPAPPPAEKELGVGQGAGGRRQVAVQVDGVGQHAGQRGLAHPPNAGQPDDRSLGPRALDPLQPQGTPNRRRILHLVGLIGKHDCTKGLGDGAAGVAAGGSPPPAIAGHDSTHESVETGNGEAGAAGARPDEPRSDNPR